MSIVRNIKRQINPTRLPYARVDFILQPVFGDLSLHGLNVPGKLAAEIAAASGEAKAALGAARGHGVRAADRTTFAIRNLIRLSGFWLLLALRCAFDGGGFHFSLRVLVGNRNCFRL